MSNRGGLREIAADLADFIDKHPTDRGKGRGPGHDVSDEPRVPKGNPDGGQWTTAEGGSSSDDSSGDHATDSRPFWPLPPPYNMCDHGYQGESCKGWVPHFFRGKPMDYMPTQQDLDRLPMNRKNFTPGIQEQKDGCFAEAERPPEKKHQPSMKSRKPIAAR